MATILLALGATTTASAQGSGPNNYTWSADDTLTDTEVSYAYLNSNGSGSGIRGKYEDLGLQFLLTRLSGTAAGYAILQKSNDGTNWDNYWGTSADSATVANSASQILSFGVGNICYRYVRVKFLGGTTMSIKASGKWSVRDK